jgi:hypothetical protein
MKRLLSIVALLLAVVVLSAGSMTQPSTASGEADLLLRVQGPIAVAAGDVASTVVVIRHDADIQGTVARDLVVINGTARIRGTVQGNVTVANGRLELFPGARVGQQALLYRSTFSSAPGSEVVGGIHEEVGISFARAAWYFWLGFTLLVIGAGLAYAFLAERSLEGASRLILAQPGRCVLSALAVVIGLPVFAFLLVLTGIGIPLGIGVVLFVLPAVAFLGYLVAGASLGHLALRTAPESTNNPYVAVTAGLLALQGVALIPALGGLLALLASQLGAGALAYRVWRRKRGRRLARPAAAERLQPA